MGCFKKFLGVAALISSTLAGSAVAATVSNPIIWSDVPDVSMLRVEDKYYMVSTTMHVAPGVPVMTSTDLVQWRTEGYAYQTLSTNDQQSLNGGRHAYGKGSWASSIRYHKGYFYILTPSYTTGKTHLYKTKDITSEKWDEVLLPFYHDPSLFFDDDGTVWVFYGNSPIQYVQLNDDASGVKMGGKSGFVGGTDIEPIAGNNYIVKQEGAHMEKINGEYYLYTISWPSGKCRTSVVYRSKNLLSGFTGKIFLQNDGVAQGSIFDTPDGKWYAMLFRDSGPVGRIPYLVPTSWVDGWPIADGGKAPATLNLPGEQEPGYGMVTSDEFESSTFPLEWQWNHNPDNSKWKIADGKLQITTGRVDNSVFFTKNTLTQRTFGPACSGRTLVDGKNMKDGDIAGLVALQDSMGYVGLAKNNGSYSVVYYKEQQHDNSHDKYLIDSKPINGSSVYLRVDFDMQLNRDGYATFYYSTDGKSWNAFSNKTKLYYTLGMFTGYRIGLFNTATKTAGGSADFEWYKIGANVNDEIWLTSADPVPQTPFGGKAWTVPGKIQMEDFDEPGKGKDGASYSDSDAANNGDSDYREGTGVDLKNGATGVVVGWNAEGEWLEYTINVTKAGEYTMFAAVASANGGSFKLSIDGKDITEEVEVPAATAGEENYDDYNKVKANVTLPEGEHVLRFTVTKAWIDIDYMTFVAGANATDPEPILDPECNDESCETAINNVRFNVNGMQTYRVFTLNGTFVGTIQAADMQQVKNQTQNLVNKHGVYLLKSTKTGLVHRVSVTR